MGLLTLLGCSLLLLLLIYFLGLKKGKSYGLVDLYIAMVGVYFGAFSVIDIIAGQAVTEAPYVILITYLHITLAIVVIYVLALMLPRRVREFNRVIALGDYFSQVNPRTVVTLSLVVLVLDWYIYDTYGLLTYSGDELKQVGLSVPNWVGPLKNLIWNLRFGLLILIINLLIHKKQNWVSMFGLLLIPLVALQLVEGRRALIELTVLIYVMWSAHKRSALYSLKRIPLIGLTLIMVFMASNVFQNYRSFLSIEGLSNTRGSTPQFIDALFNADSTLDNLAVRTPMWKLNATIVRNQLVDPSNIHGGYMMWRQVLNAIPSVFLRDKQILGPEALTTRLYDMRGIDSFFTSDDFPTNDIASYLTDFGFFSLLALPATICLIVYCSFLGSKVFRSNAACSLVSLLCVQYLIKIENGYDLPILFRNLILLSMVCVAAQLIRSYLPKKRS